MTAPVAAIPGETREYNDPLDDVFGSPPRSPTHATSTPHSAEQPAHSADPSDVPRLRSIHVTNGYREGIAASKEQHIQEGFDEGYSLGAELGLKVGWCLGVLRGIRDALSPLPANPEQEDHIERANHNDENAITENKVHGLLTEAESDLHVRNLFGEDFFGSDGIWLYDVSDHEAEGETDVTFHDVAVAHPLLKKWTAAIHELADATGLDLQSQHQ